MRGVLALALLLVADPATGSAQPAEQSAVQSITVELSSFKFTPDTLTLRQGERYRIRFVNSSSGGHDFVAKEFFAASTLATADAAKVHDGKIDFSGGEVIEISLTPNRAGTFKSHCSHFMHSSFGMNGEIVVQPVGG
jgi:plastocyanin